MLDRINPETGEDILFDILPVIKVAAEIHTTPEGVYLVVEYPSGSGRHLSFQLE